MFRAILICASLLALAVAAPAQAVDDVHARNVRYFHAMLGSPDLATQVTFPDGTTMDLAGALDLAADRAGSVDLGAMAAGAAPGLGEHFGDIWISGLGEGACPIGTLPMSTGLAVPIIPQLSVYGGAPGSISGSGGSYTLTAWTEKTTENGGSFSATGIIDSFCFGFAGIHVLFLMMDGWASMD